MGTAFRGEAIGLISPYKCLWRKIFSRIGEKGSSCCSTSGQPGEVNIKDHWNNHYINNPDEKLGWYETDLTPSLDMLNKTGLSSTARILNVGAGSTPLIDALLTRGYLNVLATDISEISLNSLKARLGNQKDKVEWIVDDITNPLSLNKIEPVDLWIDRAVLHFLIEPNEQNNYFTLLKKSIKQGGFALLAEYNLEGATKCAGLPVYRYSKEMLAERLGNNFELISSFNYDYTMPSGAIRPYVYTLFKKK